MQNYYCYIYSIRFHQPQILSPGPQLNPPFRPLLKIPSHASVTLLELKVDHAPQSDLKELHLPSSGLDPPDEGPIPLVLRKSPQSSSLHALFVVVVVTMTANAPISRL